MLAEAIIITSITVMGKEDLTSAEHPGSQLSATPGKLARHKSAPWGTLSLERPGMQIKQDV